MNIDNTPNTQANYCLVETLSEPQSRFKDIIEQMNEIVFTVNFNGCFTFLNPAWQVHTGCKVAESIGQPIQNFIHSDDLSEFLRYFYNATPCSFKVRFLDKSYNTLWFTMSLKPIQEQSNIREFFGTLVSIIAQKNLKASETLFTSLVESTSEIFFQISSSAKLIFLNPAWSKVTGYSVEESLHQSLLFYVYEDDRSNVLQFLYTKHDTTTLESYLDFRIVTQSRQIRWVSMCVYTGGSTIQTIGKITGILQDVTMRMNADNELRICKELLSLATTASNDGIWNWNLLTDEVYFSPRWKETVGYADYELENSYSTWYNLIHPDDLKETTSKLINCLQSKNDFYEIVHRLKNKNGGWNWILSRGIVIRDASGIALRIAGSHTDITQLKRVEETLAEQHRELNTIFNMNPDGIVTFTSKNRLSSVNSAFLSMTGFSSEDLMLTSESEFINKMCSISASSLPYAIDENQPYTLIQILPVGSQIERPLYMQSDNKTDAIYQDPNVRTLKATSYELANESISKIIYFCDVTIEKEVDRMKSEFLCTAAHELRTPMSSVYGFSELLLTREFDTVTMQEILLNVHQQAASMVRILNDLLDLAKIEACTREKYHLLEQPLEAIVKQACAEFMVQGDKRTINAIFTDETHLVHMDADQIKRAITNVISNAFKYSPNGGEISLNICRRKNGEYIEVGVLVKDHGIGMTQEQISHIFERFWRGSNTNHIIGTGLGMSLVKEIMHFHQGHVEVTSELGIGTEVGLWLKEIKPERVK